LDKLAEIEEKTARIVGLLEKENASGVLLGAQHNFSWITAGARNGIDLSRDPGAGTVLITREGRRFLLASRIEMPRLLAEEVSEEQFEPVDFPWEEEKASGAFLSNLAKSLLGERAGLISDLPAGTDVRVAEGDIARCRYRLTAAEQQRIRALGTEAGMVMGEIARSVSPGKKEVEVAREVDYALAARGIKAVVNLVAADDRIKRYRHPVPTEAAWKRTLMMVVCARRHGLIVSLTRIVTVERDDLELKKRTQSAARVNSAILAATQPGRTGAEVYKTAATAYSAERYEGEIHLHHQGGACGYRTREWVAHPACAEVIERDQAFAWNPSITGTKVEETCIVTNGKAETITTSPAWPQIEVEVAGKRFVSPDVLTL
jgi:Xaa-Pro aminopeptidase